MRAERRGPSGLIVLVLAGLAAGCAPATSPSPATTAPASIGGPPATGAASPSGTSAVATTLPAESGFAFDAASVLGYYQSQGYTCGEVRTSSQAAGFSIRSCDFVDAAGRTRVVGLVTDPNGDLAEGIASVRGTADEPILAPEVALEPLAGFLGAMLGETRGEGLLPWLAAHLGEDYAQTNVGDLVVATFLASPDDHATIYVEVGNQAFINAPTAAPG